VEHAQRVQQYGFEDAQVRAAHMCGLIDSHADLVSRRHCSWAVHTVAARSAIAPLAMLRSTGSRVRARSERALGTIEITPHQQLCTPLGNLLHTWTPCTCASTRNVPRPDGVGSLRVLSNVQQGLCSSSCVVQAPLRR